MFFTRYKNEYRSISTLGIPIIIGQVGTIVLSFADTIMIGHHSTPELAAAAFVSNLFAIGLLIAMGFAYGMTPVVGSCFGRGEYGRIGSVVKNALTANTLVALLLVAAYSALYANLDRLGQPEELLPYMRPYFIVNLLSMPFVCWFNVFKQTADGTTDTKMPMWILICGNILNIFGNWLLIYGHCGLPELGLLGAGISTLLSRVVMTVAIALIFFTSGRYEKMRMAFRNSSNNKADFIRLNKMGWPLSLQMSMEGGAWSLASVIVGWIGALPLAAHQVMLSISQLFYQFYYAIGASVAIRVSLFIGQKDYQRIPATAWAGYHISVLLALCMSAIVWPLRHEIGWLFTDSADVANMVAGVVVPLVIYQFADSLQCVFSNTLRGMSYVKPMVLVAFIAYFVISLPLAYFFGIVLKGSLVGVWASFPFGLTASAIMYYSFYRHRLHMLMKSN